MGRIVRSWEVLIRDWVGFRLGLPGDLDDLPAFAVKDGLDAVDAAVHQLAFGVGSVGSGAGFVGAPEVGKVGPGVVVDLDLHLDEDGAAALGHGVYPALDGEDARRGGAVGGDADRNEAGVR